MEPSTGVQKKKVNFYISYIKGIALVFIVLIHLIDWSGAPVPLGVFLLKELFHVGILLFILTSGAVILIAYKNKPIRKIFERLIYRSAQLLLFYYAYSFIKLFIFDFSTEPFYEEFITIGTLTFQHILTFHSFSVPLTILIAYVCFLAVSPFLLLIDKKITYSKISIAILAVLFFFINYVTNVPTINNPIINFLYTNGYALFPIALWFVPFLIGFSFAQIGFEKQKKNIFVISSIVLTIYILVFSFQGKPLFPSSYQFPLDPYFIVFSIFVMSLFLYGFHYFEKKNTPWIQKILAGIRLLGDNTLHLYIYHWMVIDFTIWILAPYTGYIWVTMPIFFVLYLFIKKNKFSEYYVNQKDVVQDMGREIS
ncbi:acyltransferase [Candidatus Parcubacteria bacterium]|jgi:hypothetical protein|nr:MAG: acyltransferase [Candidatus Parcubacteria bacterium]